MCSQKNAQYFLRNFFMFFRTPPLQALHIHDIFMHERSKSTGNYNENRKKSWITRKGNERKCN